MVPQTMKAVQVLGDISAPRVVANYSMPNSTPQGAEILVKVHAAGVTGDEVLWPELYETTSRIPGHDISGTIYAVGPEYRGSLKVGQEVFALIAADRGEGQAEYAACLADEVAPKPASISHAQAAALPIPALTAWQATMDHGQVKPGMRLLVTGASGAVGTMAIQLATQLAGAHVIALASSRNHDALRQFGASEVSDYNTPEWQGKMKKVDVVFDTVGGDILTKTWEVVKDDGAIITVGDPPPKWAFGRGPADETVNHPGVRYMHFIVSPDAQRMSNVGGMIDAGSVKALAEKSFPFEEAEEAWTHARQRNRGQKVVIVFGEDTLSP